MDIHLPSRHWNTFCNLAYPGRFEKCFLLTSQLPTDQFDVVQFLFLHDSYWYSKTCKAVKFTPPE